MHHARLFAIASAVVLTVATMAATQQTVQVHPGKGGSPHVKTSWTIDGAAISIEYGRPSIKGRPESELMPAGEPWRVGADEATTLVTDKPLKFGALAVPAGTYSLYAVPGATSWQLIVNKTTGKWGVPYPGAASDHGRSPMTVSKTAKPVEQLSITVQDTPAGATLHVEWGSTRASIPFTVG